MKKGKKGMISTGGNVQLTLTLILLLLVPGIYCKAGTTNINNLNRPEETRQQDLYKPWTDFTVTSIYAFRRLGGEDIDVTFTVRNKGGIWPKSVNPIPVYIYSMRNGYSPEGNASYNYSKGSRNKAKVTISFPTGGDEVDIYVKIDPLNVAKERDESNNRCKLTLPQMSRRATIKCN